MRRRHMIIATLVAVAATIAAATALAARTDKAASPGPLFGVLTGAKERPAPGDANGRGGVSAVIAKGKLCYGITVKGISKPVAAHIHRGTANVSGPIVLALRQPATGDPGVSSACVSVPAALATELLTAPGGFYWNVHTTDFPAGAIRGQLFAKTS